MKKLAFILLLFTFHVSRLTFDVLAQQPTQEWVRRGPIVSAFKVGIGKDNAGNIYVAGVGWSFPNNYISLIKYSQAGVQQWLRQYYYPSSNNNLDFNGLAVDTAGNSYVLGSEGPIGLDHMILLKYRPNGDSLWAARYFAPSGLELGPYAIKVDNSGNSYVCGTFARPNNHLSGYVIKYNVQGDSIWVKNYVQQGYANTQFRALAIDNNYAYVCGRSDSGGLGAPCVTVKFDLNGVFQWVKNGPNSPTNIGIAISPDRFGNIIVTGAIYFGSNSINYQTIKYNSSGFQQWIKYYAGPLNIDFSRAIVVDSLGNSYVTGASYITSGNNPDYLTIKYNPAGDSLWVKRYNGPGNNNDEAFALALGDSLNVYVTGQSTGTSSFLDYATIKYNTIGTQQWAARYNGIVNGSDGATGIIVDKFRNVYVTGGSKGNDPNYADITTIKYSQPLGIVPVAGELPETFKLYQNYPNPFNPKSNIKYQIPKNKSNIKIIIYDITGKIVTILVNEQQNAGTYEVGFSGNNYSSGTYFYSLIIDNKIIDTKKMILAK